jgi:1-acyl-sn-glycerol-3-phosphate acyltransferase
MQCSMCNVIIFVTVYLCICYNTFENDMYSKVENGIHYTISWTFQQTYSVIPVTGSEELPAEGNSIPSQALQSTHCILNHEGNMSQDSSVGI